MDKETITVAVCGALVFVAIAALLRAGFWLITQYPPP